jgi:hypothetical protein
MWLEPVGLEQATAEPVARHKARRFGGSLVVDLCSGIGGDAVALADAADVLAVDADLGMCRRMRWNAAVYDVASRVEVVCGRAERQPLPAASLVHIDPDRRARSPARVRGIAGYQPGLEYLAELPRRVVGGAIKLGPASDFADHFGDAEHEVELISLGGECKEATAWFGTLATCRRRATRLPEGVSWTDRDGDAGSPAPVADPGAWVYDPDPSLGRAGLLDAFAIAHGLSRCGPGIDFVTGSVRVASPFLAAFEVEEVLRLDLKRLRRLVAERGLGPLEIKTKGLDLRPEAVRDHLKPRGERPATLLLMRSPGRCLAVLSRRADDSS